MGSNGITSAAADQPHGWGRAARRAAPTPNIDRPELAAVRPAPEPTNVLVENVFTALAAHEEARKHAGQLRDGLHEGLHPEVMRLVNKLSDAETANSQRYFDLVVAELARHLPLIAPAIPILVEHIYFEGLSQHGACCTAKGQYAAVDPIPPGVRPFQPTNRPQPNPLEKLAASVTPELMHDLSRAAREAFGALRSGGAIPADEVSEPDTLLKGQISDEQYELHLNLAMAAERFSQNMVAWQLAELCRHLPSLAVPIQMVWDHVVNMNADEAGTCCMGSEEPADPS